MKSRNSGGGYRREKAILIASGFIILTAMTVTGVYIRSSRQAGEQENPIVDFSVLENGASDKNEEISSAGNKSAQNLTSSEEEGELDYDPYYAQLDEQENAAATVSGNGTAELRQDTADKAENPVIADGAANETVETAHPNSYSQMTKNSDGTVQADGNQTDSADASQENTAGADVDAADPVNAGASGKNTGAIADVSLEESRLNFAMQKKLDWPITGNVLLNYSMNRTIFFPTLQQYKYNPSIVIAAAQGTSVASAVDGVVKKVWQDPQTGTTVVMNIGDGYELTYGQLADVTVEEGDYVEKGVYIGKVAAPTKYYSLEGTNVYFKLTKDGKPVNPLDFLG